jgi:chorismate mutase
MKNKELILKTVIEVLEMHDDESTQPGFNDDAELLYSKLVKLRAQIDRVNSLLLQALTVQNEVRHALAKAKEEHEDSWNKQAAKGHVPEYSSAKERDATYSVATIELKIKQRVVERSAADIDYLVDYLKTAQRGMDGRRRDLDSLVRARASAQALER